jgi:exopolysaccharide biosynthesis WecB/TagA/CpsF family protein
VDTLPILCAMAAEEGYSVFFLGGEEGVAAETAAIMKVRFPALRVAGTHSPPYRFEFDPEEEAKVIQRIREAKPDLLFLAISSPRAETWLYRRKTELGVPVTMAVGGTFNFITGREKRAPAWMQRIGCEWVYRLWQRPGDIWRRIVINAPYFLLLFLDLLSYRLQKRITRWIRPLSMAVVDGLLSSSTFLFSYWLYFRSGLFSNTADPFPEIASLLNMPAYSELLGIVAIIGVVSLRSVRLYSRDKYCTYHDIVVRVLRGSLLTVLLLICFQFLFLKNLFKQYQFLGYSRVVFGFFGLFLWMGWTAWRSAFHAMEQGLHRRGYHLDRIILVGTTPNAQAVANELHHHPELGIQPLGFILTPESQPQAHPSQILGTIKDLRRLLPARKVDEILIADPHLSKKDLLEIVHLGQKHGVTLSVIPTIHELLGLSSQIKQIGAYKVITVSPDGNMERWLASTEKPG